MPELFYEDLEEGMGAEVGSYTFQEREIIEFAEQYDPFDFHVDPRVAEELFGGLIASGLQLLGICQRKVVDHFLGNVRTRAGLGLEEMRIFHPVFAGDTVTFEYEILGKRPLESQENQGIVRINYRGQNQNGESIFSTIPLPIVDYRPTEAVS